MPSPTGPRVVIDEESFVPLAEQVRRSILDEVQRGALRPGDRLPTVRQLARDLALAPGTVAKAYQLLENDGVLAARGRHGSFITGGLDLPAYTSESRAQPASPLELAARDFLDQAARLGHSPAEAAAAVESVAGRIVARAGL